MTTNDTNLESSPCLGMDSVRPVLRSLMLAHTFLILLIPLLFALLYYSTPHSRRRPIFILNLLAIAMDVSIGVLADTAGVHTILSPEDPLPPMLYIASGIIGIFLSMLVDLILLMRLVSAHPLGRVGTRQFSLVVFLPIFLKVARTINVVVFLKILSDITRTSGQEVISAYFTLPCLKIEWAAQVIDNSYASVMFLWTIYGQGTITECPSGGSDSAIQPSLAHRVQFLFRIAVFNFVIPTLFSIVQLIISFQDVYSGYVGDIIYVNGMVSVYGVVFASVWAGKESLRNWKEAKHWINWEQNHNHSHNNNNNKYRHHQRMIDGNDVEGVGEAWKEARCLTTESAGATRQTVTGDDSRSEVLDSTFEGTERGFADFVGDDMDIQLSVNRSHVVV